MAPTVLKVSKIAEDLSALHGPLIHRNRVSGEALHRPPRSVPQPERHCETIMITWKLGADGRRDVPLRFRHRHGGGVSPCSHDERVPVVPRLLDDADLDALFAWERDPRSVQMAAFTRADPSNRAAFDVHYQRIRNDPTVTLRAVDDDNGLVGTVASFMMEATVRSPTG